MRAMFMFSQPRVHGTFMAEKRHKKNLVKIKNCSTHNNNNNNEVYVCFWRGRQLINRRKPSHLQRLCHNNSGFA